VGDEARYQAYVQLGLEQKLERERETAAEEREAGARSSRARGPGDSAGRLQQRAMTGERESERRLLTEILARIEELSEARHRMAREHRILVHAATELRMGRDGDAVLADIREQSPEIALGALPAPVRPLGRIAASA
jgi:hypothetical protein